MFLEIKVITKLPNSEQSYKGKVQTISFATLFRVVANEDLVNPGDVLAGVLSSLFGSYINNLDERNRLFKSQQFMK